MKRRTTNYIQSVSHILLFIISAILTCSLLSSLSDIWYLKIALVIFGITIEMFKVYLFLYVKENFLHRKIFPAIIKLIVFLGLAIVSLLASLGFTLSSISTQSFNAESANIVVNSTIENISELDNSISESWNQIERYKTTMDELDATWITGKERYQKLIDSEELKIETYKLEREEMRAIQFENNDLEIVSSSTFALIGEKINITGNEMVFRLMLLLIILLEVGLVLTCGNITDELQANFKLVKRYMDECGVINSSDTTKSDKEIHEMSGLNIADIKKCRHSLENMFFDNKPLLVKSRNTCDKSNYSKSDILKILEFDENTKKKGEK